MLLSNEIKKKFKTLAEWQQIAKEYQLDNFWLTLLI